MRRLLALALAGVMAWAVLAAHDQDNTPTASPPAVVDTSPVRGVDAISPAALRQASAQLAALAVKGRAPKTGYGRSQFGQRWSDDVDVDLGHNGCD
ncbi:MAG: deoxyribonuclease, partial [Humibacillus sp.]|nr:deoxyribonuclease [Humibacillus sp.]